jgi:predicted small secreted protein
MREVWFMNNTTKSIIAFLTLLGIALASTGCNTMHGLGEDIEEAGEEIQEGAD